MEQLEFFTIPNPCKGVCDTNPKGFCKGCYRRREERQYWLKFSDAEKQKILRLCRLRKKRDLQEQTRQQPISADNTSPQNSFEF
ncbi:DUF1289 domain-containing protein [Stenoxybacter acetivorans]|uniref:DUF1289 domain-containing protein n=1 Tax=Stenoxybacter acetivorans TaxID=422441 RepID=UPI0005636AF1|nr:DUF1289 domain-containing protein [Stenoxybacter acetivorans]